MVCLQLRQCDFSGSQLQLSGFQPFAKYEKTEDLPAVAMTIAFGPHPTARYLGAVDWEAENYVFDSADLPAVCTSLLRMEARGHGILTGSPLQVTIDARIGERLRESKDGFPHPHSRLRTLLDPLRRLHGLDGVKVDGPGSTVYKDEIIASMSELPNAKETMKQALLAASRGEKASEFGDLPLAIDMYKAGLEFSRGNTPDPWSEVTQRYVKRSQGSSFEWSQTENATFVFKFISLQDYLMLEHMLTLSSQCNGRHHSPIANTHCCRLSPMGKIADGPNIRRACLRSSSRL